MGYYRRENNKKTNSERLVDVCFEVYVRNTRALATEITDKDVCGYDTNAHAVNPGYSPSDYVFRFRGSIYNVAHPYSHEACAFDKNC